MSNDGGGRRVAIVAAVLVVLAAAGLLLRGRSTTPGGPQPQAAGGLRPTLEAFSTALDAGVLSPDGELTLKVTLAGTAWVYLFDEYEGVPVLLSEHEGPAWEAGEYTTDLEPLKAIGRHHLIAVASPSRLERTKEWKLVVPEAIAITCPRCETADVTVFVAGERPPQGPASAGASTDQ